MHSSFAVNSLHSIDCSAGRSRLRCSAMMPNESAALLLLSLVPAISLSGCDGRLGFGGFGGNVVKHL